MLETLLAYTLFGLWVGFIGSIVMTVMQHAYKSYKNSIEETKLEIYKLNKSEPSMPCIKATLGGEEVYFILDTASDINFVDPEVIRELPVATIRLPNSNTVVETSTLQSIAGEVEAYHCEADLILAGIEFKNIPFRLPSSSMKLRSVLGLPEDSDYVVAGVLGHNFIRDNQWIIDLNNNSIRNVKDIKTTK